MYGAEAVDTGGEWRNTCWSRTSPPALGHKSCVVAALIARVKTCSDFRLASHVSHSRTERRSHYALASQHTPSPRPSPPTCPDLARYVLVHCIEGRWERVCGSQTKHESGPHQCSPQLLSLHQVPPCRVRHLHIVDARLLCELRQTAAVGWCPETHTTALRGEVIIESCWGLGTKEFREILLN